MPSKKIAKPSPLEKLLLSASQMDLDESIKKQTRDLVMNLFVKYGLVRLPHLQVGVYWHRGTRQGVGFRAKNKIQRIMLQVSTKGLLTLQSTDPEWPNSSLVDIPQFTLFEPTGENLEKLAKKIKAMKLKP